MKTLYIGSGPISNFHLPAAINNGFEIKTITSTPNSERCHQISKKFDLINSYSPRGWEIEIKNSSLYDCIIICVDTRVTPKILLEAAKTGKPILVEKPAAWHSSYLSNIDNPSNIIVAYNRRYYDTSKRVKSFVRSNYSGVLYVNIPDNPGTLRQYLVNSCHMLDLARYLVGDIAIDHSSLIHDEDNVTSGIAAIGHAKNNNWKVIFQCSWSTPDNFSIKAASNGHIYELRPIECLSIYNDIEVKQPTDACPIRQYLPKKISEIYENADYKPGFNLQYSSFLEFVKSRKLSEGMCSFEDSQKTLELCHELIKDLSLPSSSFFNF